MKVLTFTGSYLPGTKSAGVTTSLLNMVERLSPEIEFYILTEDRDVGASQPYQDVPLEQWTTYGKAHVYYSRKYIESLRELKRIICGTDFDVYYFCGFYNIKDNVRPMILYWLHQIPRKKVVISPHGIFSMGEYGNKKFARKLYRMFFRASGLLHKVQFLVTAEMEKQDVLNNFSTKGNDITVIQNLSGLTLKADGARHPRKEKGKLKAVFISRISAKKNIKFAIELISKVRGEVEYHLYGMIGTAEDKQYWDECQELIKQLPQDKHVIFHGEVNHDEVSSLFRISHLFLFPTHGENYGHVIAESLANGCPLLLSDMTPWNDTNKYEAGRCFPLTDIDGFHNTLQEYVDMGQEEWNNHSDNALRYAKEAINEEKAIRQYKGFFYKMVEDGPE